MAEADVLVSLGCDYITATAPETGGLNCLHSLATGIFRTQADLGNRISSWGMSGFSGWKCGSVQIGVRNETVLVRLSSDSAALSWRQLIPLAANVSRLDLQATVQVSGGVTQRIERHRRAARSDAKKTFDRKIVRWVADNQGGYTLYLGSRQSNCFGRVYDKFTESKLDQYRQCVRYEVQFQNDLAWSLSKALEPLGSPMPTIAGYISRFLKGRGVDVEFAWDAAATYCCSRPRSDADKSLAWLSHTVRPSVIRLIALGRADEVLRALGLVDDEANSLVPLDHDYVN